MCISVHCAVHHPRPSRRSGLWCSVGFLPGPTKMGSNLPSENSLMRQLVRTCVELCRVAWLNVSPHTSSMEMSSRRCIVVDRSTRCACNWLTESVIRHFTLDLTTVETRLISGFVVLLSSVKVSSFANAMTSPVSLCIHRGLSPPSSMSWSHPLCCSQHLLCTPLSYSGTPLLSDNPCCCQCHDRLCELQSPVSCRTRNG